MRKILKYTKITVISLLLTFILLVGGGMAVVYFYEDEIVAYSLDQLKKELNTEVSIESVDLTLIKTFPNASLVFHNVKAKDATKKYKRGNLFKVEKIYLAFNFWNIFDGNYKIKRIKLENGAINLKIYPNGSNNFQLMKPSTDKGGKKKFALSLDKVSFTNIKFSYRNALSKADIKVAANSLLFKGKFSEEEYDMSVAADLDVKSLKFSEVNYFKQDEVEIDISLNVFKNKSYKINKGNLEFAGQVFDVIGLLEKKTYWYADIQLKGSDLSIQKVIEHVPEKYAEKVKAYDSKGDMYFNIGLKGELAPGNIPGINAAFGIRNGEISNSETDINLKNINFTGNFTNGNAHKPATSVLVINGFNASLDNGSFSGDFSINNFESPTYKVKARASMDIARLLKFFPVDTITEATGNIKLNVDFESKPANVNKFTVDDFMKSTTVGKIELTDASVSFKNSTKPISSVNVALQFDNNDVIVDNLGFRVAESDIQLKGECRNFLSYLFLPNQKLFIKADVRCSKLDLDALLADNRSTKSDESYKLKLSDEYDFNVDVNIGRLSFRRFEGSNIKGNLILKDRKCLANNVSINAVGGQINVNGNLDGSNVQEIKIMGDAKISKLDIKKLFYQFENFGQKGITDMNLKGLATADVQFSLTGSSALKFDVSKLFVLCSLTIEQGELVNYAPLKGLSKFVNVEDLNHIRFQTLKNTIEIKDKRISIPKMEINSTALNLSGSGVHYFDGHLDYRVQVELSDILSGKARKAGRGDEEFGKIEDDGYGRMKLPIHIYGYAGNIKYAYDTKAVKQKITEDFKAEKQNIKQILNEEFGWFKKDSTLKKKDTQINKKTDNKSNTTPANQQKKKKKDEEIEDGFNVQWE